MLAEDVSIIEKAEGIQEKPVTSYMVKLGIDNHWKWKWKSLSRVLLFATTWTIQSTEFSRPELEWKTVSFSKGSSQARDQTQVSCIANGLSTSWATREAPLHAHFSSMFLTFSFAL